MTATNNKPATINAYIASFPKEVQVQLNILRDAIKKAAPDTTEAIKYAMPTFVLNGNLIHFAAFQNHIGLYSVPSGLEAFKKDFSIYKTGKGSVQFPLSEPLPLELIAKLVKFRVAENLKKLSSK